MKKSLTPSLKDGLSDTAVSRRRRKRRSHVTTLGLDLSLTRTGIVVLRDASVIDYCDVKTTNKDVEEVRHQVIWNMIHHFWQKYKPEMVMVEAAIGGGRTAHVTHRLNAVVCWELYKHDIVFETIHPSTLKKNATGNGRASKDEMVDAARVSWPECPHDDCADAYWLAVEATKIRTESV